MSKREFITSLTYACASFGAFRPVYARKGLLPALAATLKEFRDAFKR